MFQTAWPGFQLPSLTKTNIYYVFYPSLGTQTLVLAVLGIKYMVTTGWKTLKTAYMVGSGSGYSRIL